MTRKCLIALVVIALSVGTVAEAHPAWGYGVTTTITYEWATKECKPIPVCMKIVRWAQLYGCWKPVMLTQQESDNGLYWKAGDFVGCSWLKVCNNFVNLRVDGRLEATKLSNGDPVVKVKKWFISLVYAPEKGTTTLASHDVPDHHPNPKWNLTRDGIWGELPGDDSPGQAGPWDYSAKTTEVVEDVHLTGQLGWLSLCARACGVDPQSAQFFPENPTANMVQAATIYLTYYPNDPPGPGDYAQAAVGSDGGPYPTDALNDPDIIWEPLTGGGAGIP